MKKKMQKLALAAIIGSLAVITGCDQNNNGMKDRNGKQQKEDKSWQKRNDQDQDNGYNGC